MRRPVRAAIFGLALGLAPGLAFAQATQPAAKAAPAAALLDINSATADQIEALPGIGSAAAAMIVKGRPYKAKEALEQVLSGRAYAAIKDKIVVK